MIYYYKRTTIKVLTLKTPGLNPPNDARDDSPQVTKDNNK